MDKGLYEFLKKYVVEREIKKEMVKEYEEDYKIKVLYIGKHFSIYQYYSIRNTLFCSKVAQYWFYYFHHFFRYSLGLISSIFLNTLLK